MSGVGTLGPHLKSGATTLCRCWCILRRDGVSFAFTDHDLPVELDGITYAPGEAMTARSLERTTGLSVDNSEAMGALSDAGLTEGDILAGRFDGAEIELRLVNWARTEERMILFRGEIGEIERAGGAFKAELRGIAERLNTPRGRLYQRQCRAVLGDTECGVDLAGFSHNAVVEAVEGTVLTVPLQPREPGWFAQGTLHVLDGAARGETRSIRTDETVGANRRIGLWTATGGAIVPGDRVRILAGCDKRAETCRAKFANMTNFRGCPHMPDEDWLMAYPVSGQGS